MLSFNNIDVSVQFSDSPDNESSANTFLNTIIPFSVTGHRIMKPLNLFQNNKDRNIESSSLISSFIRTQTLVAGITKFSECSNAIREIYFTDIEKEITGYNSATTVLNFKEISASPD